MDVSEDSEFIANLFTYLERLKTCLTHVTLNLFIVCTRGVQKDCGTTMKEQSYKGLSMYENTASQYKNIYEEKSFQNFLLSGHA